MRFPKYLTACIFAALFAFGLSAQKRTTAQEYIEKYKHLAIENQEIYGIPASIIMAQGLLESDCGNSRLALEANNHFGIKCKREWTGPTILHNDDAPDECFRKYPTAEDSFLDHSEFLDKSPRYQTLFDLDISDYKAWAHGLRSCGYATNPKYGDLLIKVIEENQLYLLDSGITARHEPSAPVPVDLAAVPEEQGGRVTAADNQSKIDVDNYVVSIRRVGNYPIYYNNGSEFIVARGGDTFEILSQVTGISSKKLRKFNELVTGGQPSEGDPVYIRPKAKCALNGKLIHIARDGETMHSISQAYGIRLSKLAGMNRRPADSQLRTGQQIRLM